MEITVELGGLFEHQREFLGVEKRFAAVCAGWKAGKSTAASYYAARELLRRPRARGCWLSPVYEQAVKIGMEGISGLLPAGYFTPRTSGTPTITVANGAEISFRSAEEPSRLFGFAHDFLVVDEGWNVSAASWHAALSTLVATNVPVRVLSNAGTRGTWLHELFMRGVDGDPDVWSARWPTALNPTVSRATIEEARRRLSAQRFRSEWLGEFLDVGSAIFGDIRPCIVGELQEPRAGAEYVGGLDVARSIDYNVATIIDVRTRNVVAWSRWTGTSWESTYARVAALSAKYNRCRFFCDRTGLGDVVLERLERAGVPVEGILFTNASKRDMLDELTNRLQRVEITFPPIEVLIAELESFTSSTTPNGTIRYHAPGAGHDDAVISLGLAVWGLRDSYPLSMSDISFGDASGAPFDGRPGWGDVGGASWGNAPTRAPRSSEWD